MSNATRKLKDAQEFAMATGLIKKNDKPKKIYLCDPDRNLKCTGNGKATCMTDLCFCTTHPEYSQNCHALSKAEYHYYQQLYSVKIHQDTVTADDHKEEVDEIGA